MQIYQSANSSSGQNNHVMNFVCILGIVLCQSNNEKIIVAFNKEQCIEDMFKKLYFIKLEVFNLINKFNFSENVYI